MPAARRGRDLCIRSFRSLRVSSPVYRAVSKLKSWVFSDEFAMWSLIFILLNISLYIAIIVALYVAIVNIVYTDHDEHDTIDMEDLR